MVSNVLMMALPAALILIYPLGLLAAIVYSYYELNYIEEDDDG